MKSSITFMDGWTYADLRSLDPVDADVDDVDVIAIYTRVSNHALQIRLDLLDITPGRVIEFYLAIDNSPGGSNTLITDRILEFGDFNWEYVLYFSSIGENKIYDLTNKLINSKLTVYFDIVNDAVYITLPPELTLANYLSSYSPYKIKAFVFDRDTPSISDQVGPVSGNLPPPPGVPILFSFYNAYSPMTPSQALRSWDGAHTGPNSERHGYKYLLKAAYQYGIPILVDNNSSTYTIGLEYVGVKDYVGIFDDVGLLFYGGLCMGDYDYTKYLLIDSSNSATPKGLSRDTIRELLNAAIEGDERYIVLCSPLENTGWGIPEAVNNSLRYISMHPWIRPDGIASLTTNVLRYQLQDPDDLFHILAADRGIHILANSNINLALLRAINTLPDNQLGNYAKHIFDLLAAEISTSANQWSNDYTSILGYIINASHWASSPTPLANCQDDIDWDGQPNCVLATSNIYSIFEPRGGYLSYLAYLTPDGSPHQIISPTYQLPLFLGAGSQGEFVDNGFRDLNKSIGAFAGVSEAASNYRHKLSDRQITFYIPDSTIQKNYELTNHSLKIHINDADIIQNYQVPFIIDPWNIYAPTWLDSYTVDFKDDSLDDSLTISIRDSISIFVYSSSPPTVSSFITPREFMASPEDPNYDYTSGYHVPFTLTQCNYNRSSDLSVDILFAP